MKEIFHSIRFRVWFIFVVFALLIISFLYVFQILMLPGYYEHMKIKETSEAVKEIKRTWNYEPENLSLVVTEIATQQRIYIEVSDQNRVYARKSSLDKNNYEISEILNGIEESNMEQHYFGNDVYFTATIPRSHNNSKAIIMIAKINDKSVVNSYYSPTGEVKVHIFNYLEPLGTTLNIINSQLVLVSVIIIIFAFVLSVFFSNSITNPIIQISKSALKLPAGEFHMDVKKYQFWEINELTEVLNSASEEIAKTDNLRKDLMANISHDLRTPLTMIKAYAEMIRDLSGDIPEKREKHVQVIIDEADRLTSLVTDILDLSKLQSGVAEMKYDTTDFSQHLSDLVSRFELLNEIKEYKVELSNEPDIHIYADIQKIDQVVYNFINNAITYTGEDKTVKVRLYRKGNGICRFEVTDSGIGIDEENLKYIWDRYYRVKKTGETHKRAKKGSGLGLSIVKGVLDMHKFNFGADSTVGVGSTFWFEFPEYIIQKETTPPPTKKSKKK